MPEIKIIAFTRGVPAPESFPTEQLAWCASELIKEEGGFILQYGEAAGYQPLRELIAAQADVSPERVIIGQGSLQILDHVVRWLIKPGDVVMVEQPTYDRSLNLLERAGARVIGIDLEEDGISIEALEIELKKGSRPILFYLIPDFQNPTGSVMSLAKRYRLLDLADQYGFLVVEDAPYRTLRYSGNELPCLFDLNPSKVLQMSSFSKLISPGLRVGYAILPPAIAAQVIEFAGDTYINAPFLNQAMVYRFIQKGWLDPHLADLKELYSKRLECLLAALDEQLKNKGIWTHPQGGFFIGFTAHQDLEIAELMKKAERIGLQLSDGRGFFVQGGQNFIRLPFCALTPGEIQTGIQRLAQLL
jgi:DNA-binding transcriptional MocR family regulator